MNKNKGISSIYLNGTIEKNERSQNFDFARKFYIRRSNNKVDSIETGPRFTS